MPSFRLVLRDLASSNGTRLDKVDVCAGTDASLEDGAFLYIGRTTLRVAVTQLGTARAGAGDGAAPSGTTTTHGVVPKAEPGTSADSLGGTSQCPICGHQVKLVSDEVKHAPGTLCWWGLSLMCAFCCTGLLYAGVCAPCSVLC